MMQRFQNILVVVDTAFDEHPALDQGVRLARENGAKLKIADVVPEFSWPVRMTLSRSNEVRELMVNEKARRLSELAKPLQAAGLDVQTVVLHGQTSEMVTREVAQHGHDLVVRVTKGKRSRSQGFLGTTSIRLLRNCPCAVWLIKPEPHPEYHRVVAAIDVAAVDETHRELNKTILRLAKSISETHGCRLDIVYAWTIYGENILRDHMRPDEFAELETETLADQQRSLDEVLQGADLNAAETNVQLLHGDTSYEIPRYLQQHQADLLVMGTVCRRGLAGFFVGNTAEQILDKVECAILAVKPGQVTGTA
jgi:universal stress protein E